MDFFNQTGKLAIGSRLRMLTDKITVDAAAIYKMFGVDLKPKWFPVFFVLSRGEAKTITSIAKESDILFPLADNMTMFLLPSDLSFGRLSKNGRIFCWINPCWSG